MALIIQSNPGNYYSAHGDILYVVSDLAKANDPATYNDFKYVCDVYIGGVLVARLKKIPQPDTKMGIFNIGTIVRNYITATLNPASTLRAQQLGSGAFYIPVQVKFGEEYNYITYTDLKLDERFYFNHYNGRMLGVATDLAALVGKVVSSRPLINSVMIGGGRSFIPYFPNETPIPVEIKTYNYANTLVSTQSTTVTPNAKGVAVTLNFELVENNSVDVDIQVYVNDVLTHSQFVSGTFTVSANEGDIVKVQLLTNGATPWPGTGTPFANIYITEDGVTIYNQITTDQGDPDYHVLYETSFAVKNRDYSIVGVGDNTAVPTTDIVDDTSTDYVLPYDLQLFDVSPAKINAAFTGLISEYIKYYTVKIGSTSIYKFNLVCEPKYTRYTLHFLNKFGGFESFDFTKVSRKSISIEKKDFGKLPYTVDSNGAISYYNGNNVYNETRSVFVSQFTENLILNSDLLTDDDYNWLAELLISPLVYIELNGYLVGATIKNNNYEYRKRVNDKLTSLTIELEFGDQYNAQFR